MLQTDRLSQVLNQLVKTGQLEEITHHGERLFRIRKRSDVWLTTEQIQFVVNLEDDNC
jgi:hypothetical protein